MRKLNLIIVLIVLFACNLQAQQAKYVFYFIGDGMGVNHVNATEIFLAQKEDKTGTSPLTFASFPYAAFATTYSANSPVTDSAAAGTALATGVKTNNSAIGVDANREPVENIAEKAKKAGKKVGVATTVSIDHATPASFYAHQVDRNMSYEIALDLIKADFDFYAGGGFAKPHTTFDRKEATSIYPQFEEAGYAVARGLDEYKEKAATAKKMILMQNEKDGTSLAHAIDRDEDDMTLADLTSSAIEFLTKGKNNGFFLMVEGGSIDWAGHANDGASAIAEIIDFDEAIQVAYEFYKKHPKETLIVVTADHETGGLTLGIDNIYNLQLKNLAYQKTSPDRLSRAISDYRKNNRRASWEDVKEFLGEHMGFWKEIQINWEQEKALRDVYEQSFVRNRMPMAESMYSRTEPLAAAAVKVLNETALIGWSSGGHTASYVPVFAIGAKADLFQGRMDNTDIPKRIMKAAKYK